MRQWAAAILLGFLAVIAWGIDYLAATLGVKRVGASGLAVAGAAIGTVLGLAAGLVGVLVGPFAGAALGEYAARRDLRQAGRAGLGTWLGIVLGSAAKVALMLAMVGVFGVAWLL